MNRVSLSFAVAIALFLSFAAAMSSPAFAADPRLDQARDTLVKALALVNAAEDPGAKRPFGGHAARAAELIGKALKEIELARDAADRHP